MKGKPYKVKMPKGRKTSVARGATELRFHEGKMMKKKKMKGEMMEEKMEKGKMSY